MRRIVLSGAEATAQTGRQIGAVLTAASQVLAAAAAIPDRCGVAAVYLEFQFVYCKFGFKLKPNYPLTAGRCQPVSQTPPLLTGVHLLQPLDVQKLAVGSCSLAQLDSPFSLARGAQPQAGWSTRPPREQQESYH